MFKVELMSLQYFNMWFVQLICSIDFSLLDMDPKIQSISCKYLAILVLYCNCRQASAWILKTIALLLKFRHFNDYYNDFYGPGGNLAAIPDHPVALTDARAGTANAQVHLPAATDHVKLATFNDPVQTYHRSRTTFGKIQLKKGKSDPKSVSNDQAYEYPDEQVEEIAVK